MDAKKIKGLLRIILSLAALGIIIYKVDLKQAFYYLSSAHWLFVVLALLTFLISKVIAAFRINRYYFTQDLHISDKLNLKLSFLGMFYNLFIPLIGGEGYKAFWIKKRYPVELKKLVSAALLDRASGLVALVLLTAAFFMLSSFQVPYKTGFLILVPLAYVAHFFVLKLVFKSFVPAWQITSLLSIAVQALQALTAFFVVMALNIDQHQLDYVFVFLLASFAFVLPMIGAREMAFVFGADYLGLNMELSLAIGLLFYLSMAFSSLLGSYFVLFPKHLEKYVPAKF